MASDSSRRQLDASRPTPEGALPRSRTTTALLLTMVAAVGGAAVLGLHGLRDSARVEGVPRYVSSLLGRPTSHPTPPAARSGFHVRLARAGAAASLDGHALTLAPVGVRAGEWRQYAHGAVRTTAVGHDAITTAPGAFEEFTTVDRHQGLRTWSWRLSTATLEPKLRDDGSVALLAGGRPTGLTIA